MYKVLMIAPTPFFADRGCHTQILEQMRSLQKMGHRVCLCTYHIGKDIPGYNIRRIPNFPWYRKLEAGPSYHKFYLDLFLLATSLKTAIRFKPDIIHGHLHEGAAIGYVVSRILRVPLLFDLQGSLTGELQTHKFIKEKGFLYRLFHCAERIIDNLADVVVTQSTDMHKELKEKFKVRNTELTWDGVDINDFRPGIDSDALRSQLGIPGDNKVIVYLGVMSEYQGVDALLRAIPKVVAQRQDVCFLIMGYPNVEKYRDMAGKLNIARFCKFTGRIDYEMAPEYINLGDIAVGPKLGLTEADGKIYNYMACGLSVAASDTQVHREILADTALYSEPGDSTELASSILKLLDDPDLSKKLGSMARQRVVENFTWDKVAERLIRIYERSMDGHAGRRNKKSAKR